ncbi:hypothetical protein [Nocardioides aromaticivorans]|uniref:hypothetical protein n=1 Tax=Nocardioides aromaticivorans TaxID=200618 RepID=UPI001A8EDA8B|nr:hypothetical protein [Nocardioides aromaticivorans]
MPGEDKNSGELSEVSSRKAAGPVTPGDAVAGHPFDDDVQEGAAGPDARTGDEDVDAAQEYHVADGDPEAVVDEEDLDPEAVVDEDDSAPADEDDDAYPRVQDVEEDRA